MVNKSNAVFKRDGVFYERSFRVPRQREKHGIRWSRRRIESHDMIIIVRINYIKNKNNYCCSICASVPKNRDNIKTVWILYNVNTIYNETTVGGLGTCFSTITIEVFHRNVVGCSAII